jgi:hypothetical protein
MHSELLKLTSSATDSEHPELAGVGGWLWLFCFLLTVQPLTSIVEAAIRPWNYWNIPWLCLCVFSVFTGYSLWRMTPRALLLVKVFLIMWFCLGTLALSYSIAAGTRLESGEHLESMIEAAMWFLYFKKSKRVKATFGHPI